MNESAVVQEELPGVQVDGRPSSTPGRVSPDGVRRTVEAWNWVEGRDGPGWPLARTGPMTAAIRAVRALDGARMGPDWLCMRRASLEGLWGQDE
jgi:hypothetical protein